MTSRFCDFATSSQRSAWRLMRKSFLFWGKTVQRTPWLASLASSVSSGEAPPAAPPRDAMHQTATMRAAAPRCAEWDVQSGCSGCSGCSGAAGAAALPLAPRPVEEWGERVRGTTEGARQPRLTTPCAAMQPAVERPVQLQRPERKLHRR